MKHKNLPNLLSGIRIVLALLLFFVEPLGTTFLVVYGMGGLTDILDGWIARRAGTASPLGAKLDSAADLLLVMVLVFTLYSLLALDPLLLLWILGIALLRGFSLFIAFRKYRTFASIHTWGNKATGVLVFLTPFFLLLAPPSPWVPLVCIFATASAVEELVIQLTSRELQLDCKSWFHRS
ncbi:CDP-alcohol phosphatidyltransferase family protein [Gorillibacterium sp. CAU 1737]|uniref:CDP-alcohol phosphatidyltransferase family protein n=1 Tax=Gorillibacterium sp. CAU 1737 TaxID=3140362 RepID=UPI0032614AD3